MPTAGGGLRCTEIRTLQKGCVFVDVSLTHLLGVSQVRKRVLYPRPHLDKPLAILLPMSTKARVTTVREPRRKITVAKWNQRAQLVVNVP